MEWIKTDMADSRREYICHGFDDHLVGVCNVTVENTKVH